MPLFAKSYENLMADSLADLADNTNITRLSPGGIARALLESFNRRLAEAYTTFDLNLARAFVSAAGGQYLELIGILLGVDRAVASPANTQIDETVIKFYVDSGTFGNINTSQDIVIPVGTVLSTDTNSSGIVYTTTEQITLGKNSNIGWVSAQALVPGEDSNLGSDSLTYHNFNNYSDYLNRTLLVTNVHPIANGANIESDANYKYRIVNQVTKAEAANQTALRLAILSNAGVADVILIPRYKGIGTFGAILKSTSPTVSQSLIDNVTASVLDVEGYGEVAFIRAPYETGITMALTIHYDSQLPSDTLTTIETDITNTITNYINNLDIGETFLVNRLVSQLFNINSHITNIGSIGKPVDQLYLYKDSTLGDNRVRTTLLSDYVPSFDERVIVEPSVAQPVVLSRSYISTLTG